MEMRQFDGVFFLLPPLPPVSSQMWMLHNAKRECPARSRRKRQKREAHARTPLFGGLRWGGPGKKVGRVDRRKRRRVINIISPFLRIKDRAASALLKLGLATRFATLFIAGPLHLLLPVAARLLLLPFFPLENWIQTNMGAGGIKHPVCPFSRECRKMMDGPFLCTQLSLSFPTEAGFSESEFMRQICVRA